MEVGTTTNNLTARLPILNPGDYDLWLMRIEQYFLMTDYSLWEVIKNGNKVLRRTVGTVEQEYEPTTAEEKQDRRNEMKARATLLMALPNKDQLKFHSYQDAKLLIEAIKKRYGGNKESKKVQRTLLKQQYENFAALSSETMDQTFDSQPNTPQLDQEDLEQLYPDDLEEMDLQCEMAMLTIRARRTFVPQAVLTKSRKLSTAGAAVNTVKTVNIANTKAVNTVRSVNTAASKPINSIINTIVNTTRVKHTTARDKAVVSENKGKGANSVKASACWVWKAKNSSNPQQKEYKEKEVIDSGYSRHMTGNKCYLDEYEDYDGGFVSFGDGKGRISRKGKIKTGSLDFDDVYFCKELKYNMFSVS
ncbi:hypothetical protein Tco_1171257 [Tanacetum coccineum]